MRRRILLRSWALLPAALLIGCGDETGACRTDSYPAAPADAAATLHVAAGCSEEGADGSAARPYPTIGAAVDAASAGTAVLIAPGTYAEHVKITKAISLIGSSDPASPDAAGAEIDASVGVVANCDGAETPIAIVVCGAENVVLRGLRVVKPVKAGIKVSGGSTTIEGSAILDAVADSGAFGHGLVASDNGSIILQNSLIDGSAGFSVLVSGAGATVLRSTIRRGNAGVRIERSTQDVVVQENIIEDTAQFGVGVFSSRAIILQNTIRDIKLDGSGIGDGVLVARLRDESGAELGDSDVEARNNEISRSARVGALMAAGTRGIILQHNLVTENGAVASFGAGVWLQGGAGDGLASKLEDNVLQNNTFTGIGVTGDSQGIILQNNAIEGTRLGTTFSGAQAFDVGDGIGLFDGAAASIVGNTVKTSGRFGLILDGADGTLTSIQDNAFTDNDQYGIILQGQAFEPATRDNQLTNNRLGPERRDLAAGTYSIRSEELATY